MHQTGMLRHTQGTNCKLYELMNTQAYNLGLYMTRHRDLFCLHRGISASEATS